MWPDVRERSALSGPSRGLLDGSTAASVGSAHPLARAVAEEALRHAAAVIAGARQSALEMLDEAQRLADSTAAEARRDAEAQAASLVAEAESRSASIVAEARESARSLMAEAEARGREQAQRYLESASRDGERRAAEVVSEARRRAARLVHAAESGARARARELVHAAVQVAESRVAARAPDGPPRPRGVTLTWSPVPGAQRYAVYVTRTLGDERAVVFAREDLRDNRVEVPLPAREVEDCMWTVRAGNAMGWGPLAPYTRVPAPPGREQPGPGGEPAPPSRRGGATM